MMQMKKRQTDLFRDKCDKSQSNYPMQEILLHIVLLETKLSVVFYAYRSGSTVNTAVWDNF